MIQNSPLRHKSYDLALKVVLLVKKIRHESNEYVLTKQLLKSVTSIGANVEESQQAESRRDFITKVSVAMKEAYESRYWMHLVCDSGYVSATEMQPHLLQLEEIIALLGSCIKTAKNNLK